MAAPYTALSPHTAIREANQVGHLQPTVLVAYGFDALRVPSFAPGAAAADVNLVLLRRGEPPAELRLVDDRGRLG